jgi:hypothetical protein
MTRFWCRITAAGLIENDKKYEKGQKEGKTWFNPYIRHGFHQLVLRDGGGWGGGERGLLVAGLIRICPHSHFFRQEDLARSRSWSEVDYWFQPPF